MDNLLGIYEKALPKDISWEERLKISKDIGFNFIEVSIDESDDRISRLYWSKSQRLELIKSIMHNDIPIMSMCFSAHRRFPFGSMVKENREKAFKLMEKAILFARDLGIRVIQLAGYDVYYEQSTTETRQRFIEGLKKSVALAEKYQVMLAMETMDTAFINSITRYLEIYNDINSPWFTVYPDLGNLSAWGNNVNEELKKGFSKTVAVHVKDTLPVTKNFPGQFRDVPFGQGCVDFISAFKTLKSLNYRGPFLIEMWSEKSQDPISEVVAAKEWVLERLSEAGF